MDNFSRIAFPMLIGSALVLGLGLFGLLAEQSFSSTALEHLFTGSAPVWLAMVGAIGLGAVIAIFLGSREASGDSANAEGAGSRGPKEEEASPAIDPASASDPVVAFDSTLSVLAIEVLMAPEAGSSPALGSAVPPASLCKALLSSKPSWICSKLAFGLHEELESAKTSWTEARDSLTPSVQVRGRSDGEAASYRIAVMAHVPPSSRPTSAEEALEILARLRGDSFLDIAMTRLPEQGDTFASAMTVVGSLARDELLRAVPEKTDAPTPTP